LTWFIHMCDMTHWYVWHDSFICVTRLTWLICVDMSDVSITCRMHDSFTRVTWLIHMCDMTLRICQTLARRPRITKPMILISRTLSSKSHEPFHELCVQSNTCFLCTVKNSIIHRSYYPQLYHLNITNSITNFFMSSV